MPRKANNPEAPAAEEPIAAPAYLSFEEAWDEAMAIRAADEAEAPAEDLGVLQSSGIYHFYVKG